MKLAALAPLLAAWITLTSQAAPPLPASAPDLPPLAAVRHTLHNSPDVLAARSQGQASAALRERLEAGPHEWSVRMASTRREQKVAPGERYREWELGLERAVRLPGKASADRELGAQAERQAGIALGDALHEGSRALLKAWFGWLRERESVEQWQQQTDLLDRQAQIVRRRHTLGDAARLESLQADAALAQARAQLAQAETRARTAREDLARRYPDLPLPARPQLAEPAPVAGDAEDWQRRILEHNHELMLARARGQFARLTARRADQDLLPDPTLGVRMSAERAGEERLLGFSVALPLPGAARRAGSAQAQAEAAAAAHQEAAALRRIGAEAQATYLAATGAVEAWRRSEQAARQQGEAADLLARAWQLGEAPISDMLTARRLAFEARLAARTAQVDAREAYNRLLLDAHQLWVLDAEHADEHDDDHEPPR